MICRLCNKENEFYKNQTICKECYNKRYKERYRSRKQNAEYPKARCEKCEKLFDLDFYPNKHYRLIPAEWICKECVSMV